MAPLYVPAAASGCLHAGLSLWLRVSGPGGTKPALRAEFEARRRGLAPARRALEEEVVQAFVQATPEWRAARTVLLYRSFGAEFSVVGLTLAAWRAGKRTLFPRVAGTGLILHAVSSWSELRPAGLGVSEPAASSPIVDPAEVDLAIVPGLAFSRSGDRLGRGGGHYDRLLPALRAAWGVAFDCQLVDRLPAERHDQRVHRVVTASMASAIQI